MPSVTGTEPEPVTAEFNGSPVSSEEMQALGLVNYGHFISMRVDEHRIRGLTRHLDRLAQDCRKLFDAGLDLDRVRELIRPVVSDRKESFVVRVTIFDPALELGRVGADADPGILVTTRPAGTWPSKAMRAQSFTYSRDLPDTKHVGLMGSLWCRRQAQLNGFDDALFVDATGTISEGSTWNVGFFDGARVIWPEAQLLQGVTMQLIQQVHKQTVTAPVKRGDLSGMQAGFATNTAIGVQPIASVDDTELDSGHPILAILRQEYAAIPGECP